MVNHMKKMSAMFFVGLCVSFVFFCAGTVAAQTGRTISATLRIDARAYSVKEGEAPRPDPILSRTNLIAIKQFILKQGNTQTYSNMFNNNPFFGIEGYSFYLDPDPGPNGHPQFNINCDPEKTDFHTLTIRNTGRNWGGGDQYRRIRFESMHEIYIDVSWPDNDLTVGQIRDKTEEAVKAILEEMKRIEKDRQ